MGDGAYGRLGLARTYTLVFGVFYVGVSILELFFPESDPLRIGGAVIVARTTLQNIVHWLVAIVVLGAFIAGEAASRIVAAIVGVVFVALAIWGFVAGGSLGRFFGFDGAIPVVYTIIRAVTGVLALLAGFVRRREPAMA